MEKNLIEMGYCHKPHGIKGEFQFTLFNPEESSLKKGTKIFLKPGNDKSSITQNGKEFIISSIRFGNKVIVTLKDVDDRNQVEAMIPFSIFMDRSQFDDLDEGEFYLSDLIGIEVFNPKNDLIGKVTDFYENGMQAVLVITKKTGGRVELPFVENFFPEVNIEDRTIIMIDPGFLE